MGVWQLSVHAQGLNGAYVVASPEFLCQKDSQLLSSPDYLTCSQVFNNAPTVCPAELPTLTDLSLLKKYLKVTPEELSVGSMADAQLMRIAARDC